MFVIEAYDAAMQNSEVFAYLKTLGSDPRIELFLKLRPGQEAAPFSRPVAGQVTTLKGPIDPYFAQMDVVVGSWSTAVLDAVYHQRPVVLFATSQYDDPLGLSGLGVAVRVGEPGEIVEAVLKAAQTPASALASHKRLVWGEEDRDAGEAVLSEILQAAPQR